MSSCKGRGRLGLLTSLRHERHSQGSCARRIPVSQRVRLDMVRSCAPVAEHAIHFRAVNDPARISEISTVVADPGAGARSEAVGCCFRTSRTPITTRPPIAEHAVHFRAVNDPACIAIVCIMEHLLRRCQRIRGRPDRNRVQHLIELILKFRTQGFLPTLSGGHADQRCDLHRILGDITRQKQYLASTQLGATIP